jgi:hypothetical protein
MTVYHVVFHQDQWRIRYENLLIGAFETAEAAAQAALTIARSRFAPHPHTQIFTDLNGEITVREP